MEQEEMSTAFDCQLFHPAYLTQQHQLFTGAVVTPGDDPDSNPIKDPPEEKPIPVEMPDREKPGKPITGEIND